MTAGWENLTSNGLQTVFGSDLALGLVGFLVCVLFFVFVRPPAIVSIVASGLIVLLLFSTTFGLGINMSLVLGVALIAGVLIYFVMKRPVRDY